MVGGDLIEYKIGELFLKNKNSIIFLKNRLHRVWRELVRSDAWIV